MFHVKAFLKNKDDDNEQELNSHWIYTNRDDADEKADLEYQCENDPDIGYKVVSTGGKTVYIAR